MTESNTALHLARTVGCLALCGAALMATARSRAQDVVVTTPAGAPPDTSKVEPLPRGSVTGHVTFNDTHGPARGARVLLFPAARDGGNPLGGGTPLFATTHLDGSFTIPHVRAGEYFAIALASGYLSPLDGVMFETDPDPQSQKQQGEKLDKLLRSVAPSVNVSADGAARVEIDIQRGGVLAGRVLYSDGSPAGDISVQIEKVNQPKPSSKSTQTIDVGSLLRVFTLPHSLTTDDLGNFRLAGIAPGSYRLAVTQSFENASFQDTVMTMFNPAGAQGGRLTIYSGNTLHQKEAKTFDLRAGDVVSSIEITLPLNGLHTVRGTAAGKGGVLLGTGSVDLTDTVDESISFHTTIQHDGEFAFFGIPEGSYNLKLSNGYAYDTPPPENIPEEAVTMNPQQYKPTHAFAELTQPVLVGNDDIDSLTLMPAETKLPNPPAPAESQDSLTPAEPGTPPDR